MRLALAVAVLLIAAAPAGAATVEIREGALLVSDHDGVANDIEVRAVSGSVVVIDRLVPPAVGPGCADAGDRVVCTPQGRLAAGLVAAGGGDDRITLHGMPEIVVADGGAGADVVRAVGGAPVLAGGIGPDVLDAEGGHATVTYAGRSAPVRVTPDAVADDGEIGEGDLVTAAIRRIEGGDGPDLLTAAPASVPFPTGPDMAAVRGGPGDDELHGSSSGDLLVGGPGADLLAGAAGNDRLDGGPGADRLLGGGGLDTVDYAARTADIRVTIGADADDGETGEGDYVAADITMVDTGWGHDLVVGSDRREVVRTGPGEDRLVLLGGDDQADPGTGGDDVEGGDGRDMLLLGQGGPDVADGGAGADTISGANDAAVIHGGAGPDRIQGAGARTRVFLRDGRRDELSCSQPARGRVVLDPVDRVRFCRPALRVLTKRVRARRDGSVALRFGCGTGVLDCRGSLILQSVEPAVPRLFTNRRTARIAPGDRATVRFRLGPLSRRRLAARRGVTLVTSGGSVRSAAVRVLAPRRRP